MAVNGSGLANLTPASAPSERSSSRSEWVESRTFAAGERSNISDEAQQLLRLQHLQETDPTKFRALASHISDALSAASKSQPGGESLRLSRIAQAFNPSASDAANDAATLPVSTNHNRFIRAYAAQQSARAIGDVEHIIGSALKQAGV